MKKAKVVLSPGMEIKEGIRASLEDLAKAFDLETVNPKWHEVIYDFVLNLIAHVFFFLLKILALVPLAFIAGLCWAFRYMQQWWEEL